MNKEGSQANQQFVCELGVLSIDCSWNLSFAVLRG